MTSSQHRLQVRNQYHKSQDHPHTAAVHYNPMKRELSLTWSGQPRGPWSSPQIFPLAVGCHDGAVATVHWHGGAHRLELFNVFHVSVRSKKTPQSLWPHERRRGISRLLPCLGLDRNPELLDGLQSSRSQRDSRLEDSRVLSLTVVNASWMTRDPQVFQRRHEEREASECGDSELLDDGVSLQGHVRATHWFELRGLKDLWGVSARNNLKEANGATCHHDDHNIHVPSHFNARPAYTLGGY